MQLEFNANKRDGQGTGASRRLRRTGRVPGILYGGQSAPQQIDIDHNELFQLLRKEAFYSSVLNVNLEGKKEMCLLRDVQRHPYRMQILHVDFQRIDETTKLRKKVPLHFHGEDSSPAVKTDKCLVSHVRTDLEIECLASQLPEFVTIDLSGLVKNQSLHASDLKLPEGIKAVKHGTLNPVIVAVIMPKAEEEVVAAPVVAVPEKGKGEKPKKSEKQNKK